MYDIFCHTYLQIAKLSKKDLARLCGFLLRMQVIM